MCYTIGSHKQKTCFVELVQARSRIDVLGEVMDNTISQYQYQINTCGPYSAPIVPNNPASQFNPIVNMHHLQAIYNGRINGINSAQPALTPMAFGNGFAPSAIDSLGGPLNTPPNSSILQHGLPAMSSVTANATVTTCNPRLMLTSQSHGIFHQTKDHEALFITGDMVPATVSQEVLLYNKDDIRPYSLGNQYAAMAPPPLPRRSASFNGSSYNSSLTPDTECIPSSASGDLDPSQKIEIHNPLDSNSSWSMNEFLEDDDKDSGASLLSMDGP